MSEQELTVSVVVDPGLPARRVQAVQEDMARDATSWCGRPVRLHVHERAVRLTTENSLELDDVVGAAGEREDDDHVVLVVTEIPRHTHGRPLVAELRTDVGAAILSCPTLGAWRTRWRLRRLMLSCIVRSLPDLPGREPGDLDPRWARWSEGDDGRPCLLHARGPWAPARLVIGMTVSNEPLSTASKLSGALAAASAAGAFGIFYHSIWQMAAALSPVRLLVVAATAVTAMVAWLLVSNRLWDTARLEPLRRVVALYNISTVLTLLVCVLSLYATLVVLIGLGAVLVIDMDFMASVLGFEPTWRDYLSIAWLSAAMGVVAGALGSSFDSDTEVRDLTHGQRERQREAEEERERSGGHA